MKREGLITTGVCDIPIANMLQLSRPAQPAAKRISAFSEIKRELQAKRPGGP